MIPLWFEKLADSILEGEGLPSRAAALAQRGWLSARLATHRVSNTLRAGHRTGPDRREPASHPLRIFMFHAVTPQPLEVGHFCFLEKALFVRQIETIDRHFDILPLTEAVAKLQNAELTSPAAVITFDDGFRNNFTVAYPELRRRDIPAAMFVSTGFTDTERTPWFCRVLRAVTDTTLCRFDWNGARYPLTDPAEKTRSANLLMDALKPLHQDAVDDAVADIEDALGLEPGQPVPEHSPFRMLDARAIRELSDSGLIEIGAHGHDHAILARLEAEAQREQIAASVEALAGITGRPCTLFAFPNGRADDYDRHSLACLQRAGINIALTTTPGGNATGAQRLELRRDALGPRDRGAFLENRVRWMIEHDRRCL